MTNEIKRDGKFDSSILGKETFKGMDLFGPIGEIVHTENLFSLYSGFEGETNSHNLLVLDTQKGFTFYSFVSADRGTWKKRSEFSLYQELNNNEDYAFWRVMLFVDKMREVMPKLTNKESEDVWAATVKESRMISTHISIHIGLYQHQERNLGESLGKLTDILRAKIYGKKIS